MGAAVSINGQDVDPRGVPVRTVVTIMEATDGHMHTTGKAAGLDVIEALLMRALAHVKRQLDAQALLEAQNKGPRIAVPGLQFPAPGGGLR